MTEHKAPLPSVAPFLLGDLLLLGVAGGIVYQSPWPLSVAHMALCAAAVAAGAWLMVTPFILQHRAALKLAEADALSSTVAQIQNLEQIKKQIAEATTAWQFVQGECQRTVETARQVAEGMAAEAKAFTEFMQKASDSEKATLRLEAEKLRRGEAEWLQVVVRVLDHIHALYQAGVNSGQPNLAQQLGSFQMACRDVVRRVGLAPFSPQVDEPFDAQTQQPADPRQPPPEMPVVAQVVATGYTFQGQMIRPAIVLLKPAGNAGVSPEAATPPAEPPVERAPAVADAPVTEESGERADESVKPASPPIFGQADLPIG